MSPFLRWFRLLVVCIGGEGSARLGPFLLIFRLTTTLFAVSLPLTFSFLEFPDFYFIVLLFDCFILIFRNEV